MRSRCWQALPRTPQGRDLPSCRPSTRNPHNGAERLVPGRHRRDRVHRSPVRLVGAARGDAPGDDPAAVPARDARPRLRRERHRLFLGTSLARISGDRRPCWRPTHRSTTAWRGWCIDAAARSSRSAMSPRSPACSASRPHGRWPIAWPAASPRLRPLSWSPPRPARSHRASWPAAIRCWPWRCWSLCSASWRSARCTSANRPRARASRHGGRAMSRRHWWRSIPTTPRR